MSDARSSSYITLVQDKPFKVVVSAITLVAFFNEAMSYRAKRRNSYGRIIPPFRFAKQTWRDVSRRVIASITLIAFLATSIPADLAWAGGTPSKLTSVGSDRAAGPGSSRELDPATFKLPPELGTIRDSWSAQATSSGRHPATVIHIQDAHCNYACQMKIAQTVEYLNKEYGVNIVNLEGGAEGYDLSPLTDIRDKSARNKASDYLVKEGIANGTEYFASNNTGRVGLWGIEDVGLYIENLKVYRRSLAYKADVDNYTKSLSQVLSILKAKIYSKDLLEFDLKYSQYKASNLEFKDYIDYIVGKFKERDLEIKRFPDLYILSQALGSESSINFKKANNERDSLIDILQKSLSKRAMEELVLKTVEFRSEKLSQGSFYSYLVSKAKSVNIDLKQFPELQKYIVYISMYDAINKIRVISQISEAEEMLKKSMFANKEEESLAALSKNLVLTKNLFSITMTKEDYDYYRENESSFDVADYKDFIKYYSPKYGVNIALPEKISDLDKYRKDMSRFYDYSLKRDRAFLKNIKFEEKGIGDSGRGKTAIIVTGGFHTENLAELFRKNNISYISIMPSFTNGEGYESPYYKLLSGQNVIDIRGSIKSAMAGTLAVPDVAFNPDIKRAMENLTGTPAQTTPTAQPPVIEPSVTQPTISMEEVRGILKARNWYYQWLPEERRREIERRVSEALKVSKEDKTSLANRIKDMVVAEANKRQHAIKKEDIVSVMIYGGWCYMPEGENPSDIDIAIVVKGDTPEIQFLDVKIENPDSLFGSIGRNVGKCDIRIIGANQLSVQGTVKDERTKWFEISMWGHGIPIGGSDQLGKTMPSGADLEVFANSMARLAIAHARGLTDKTLLDETGELQTVNLTPRENIGKLWKRAEEAMVVLRTALSRYPVDSENLLKPVVAAMDELEKAMPAIRAKERPEAALPYLEKLAEAITTACNAARASGSAAAHTVTTGVRLADDAKKVFGLSLGELMDMGFEEKEIMFALDGGAIAPDASFSFKENTYKQKQLQELKEKLGAMIDQKKSDTEEKKEIVIYNAGLGGEFGPVESLELIEAFYQTLRDKGEKESSWRLVFIGIDINDDVLKSAAQEFAKLQSAHPDSLIIRAVKANASLPEDLVRIRDNEGDGKRADMIINRNVHYGNRFTYFHDSATPDLKNKKNKRYRLALLISFLQIKSLMEALGKKGGLYVCEQAAGEEPIIEGARYLMIPGSRAQPTDPYSGIYDIDDTLGMHNLSEYIDMTWFNATPAQAPVGGFWFNDPDWIASAWYKEGAISLGLGAALTAISYYFGLNEFASVLNGALAGGLYFYMMHFFYNRAVMKSWTVGGLAMGTFVATATLSMGTFAATDAFHAGAYFFSALCVGLAILCVAGYSVIHYLANINYIEAMQNREPVIAVLPGIRVPATVAEISVGQIKVFGDSEYVEVLGKYYDTTDKLMVRIRGVNSIGMPTILDVTADEYLEMKSLGDILLAKGGDVLMNQEARYWIREPARILDLKFPTNQKLLDLLDQAFKLGGQANGGSLISRRQESDGYRTLLDNTRVDVCPVIIGKDGAISANPEFNDPTTPENVVKLFAHTINCIAKENPNLTRGRILNAVDRSLLSDFKRVLAHNIFGRGHNVDPVKFMTIRLSIGYSESKAMMGIVPKTERQWDILGVPSKIGYRDAAASSDTFVVENIWKVPENSPGMAGEIVIEGRWKGKAYVLYSSRSHEALGSIVHQWRSTDRIRTNGGFVKQSVENADDCSPRMCVMLDDWLYNEFTKKYSMPTATLSPAEIARINAALSAPAPFGGASILGGGKSEEAAVVAPFWEEPVFRGLSYLAIANCSGPVGITLLAIINIIFVALHWKNIKAIYGERAPPSAIIKVLAAPILVTAINLLILPFLIGNPFAFISVSTLIHFIANVAVIEINKAFEGLKLGLSTIERKDILIDLIPKLYGKDLFDFGKIKEFVIDQNMMIAADGTVFKGGIVSMHNLGNRVSSGVMLDKLVSDFVRMLGITGDTTEFRRELKGLLRDRYFESIKDLNEFEEVTLEEYANEVSALLQKHELITSGKTRARIKPILVRMARWGINLGVVDINSIKGAPALDHKPVIAISTQALAGLGDVTKIRQVVPGIAEEMAKKGISDFTVKIFVLGKDRVKIEGTGIAEDCKKWMAKYPGLKVELIFRDNKVEIGDPDIMNVDLMLVLVRPVHEVLKLPARDVPSAAIPRVTFTLGEYNSQVGANERLRAVATLEVGTGFGSETIGFFVNPQVAALYEKTKSLNAQETAAERITLLIDTVLDQRRKYTLEEYAKSHGGRAPPQELLESILAENRRNITRDTKFNEKAAELSGAGIPWGMVYMHHDGAKYIEALAQHRKDKGFNETPTVIFTFFGKVNRESEGTDEFAEMQRAVASKGINAAFYDISGDPSYLSHIDVSRPGITVINLGVRPNIVRFAALSDLPVGTTGDESLIEALTLRKPVLYEVMSWKMSLFENFIKTLEEIEDPGGPLATALKAFRSGFKTPGELAAAARIFESSSLLTETMAKLGRHVVERGLYSGLVPMLFEYMQVTKFFEDMMVRHQLDEEAQESISPLNVFDLQMSVEAKSALAGLKFKSAIDAYLKDLEKEDILKVILHAQEIKEQFYDATQKNIKMAIDEGAFKKLLEVPNIKPLKYEMVKLDILPMLPMILEENAKGLPEQMQGIKIAPQLAKIIIQRGGISASIWQKIKAFFMNMVAFIELLCSANPVAVSMVPFDIVGTWGLLLTWIHKTFESPVKWQKKAAALLAETLIDNIKADKPIDTILDLLDVAAAELAKKGQKIEITSEQMAILMEAAKKDTGIANILKKMIVPMSLWPQWKIKNFWKKAGPGSWSKNETYIRYWAAPVETVASLGFGAAVMAVLSHFGLSCPAYITIGAITSGIFFWAGHIFNRDVMNSPHVIRIAFGTAIVSAAIGLGVTFSSMTGLAIGVVIASILSGWHYKVNIEYLKKTDILTLLSGGITDQAVALNALKAKGVDIELASEIAADALARVEMGLLAKDFTVVQDFITTTYGARAPPDDVRKAKTIATVMLARETSVLTAANKDKLDMSVTAPDRAKVRIEERRDPLVVVRVDSNRDEASGGNPEGFYLRKPMEEGIFELNSRLSEIGLPIIVEDGFRTIIEQIEKIRKWMNKEIRQRLAASWQGVGNINVDVAVELAMATDYLIRDDYKTLNGSDKPEIRRVEMEKARPYFEKAYLKYSADHPELNLPELTEELKNTDTFKKMCDVVLDRVVYASPNFANPEPTMPHTCGAADIRISSAVSGEILPTKVHAIMARTGDYTQEEINNPKKVNEFKAKLKAISDKYPGNKQVAMLVACATATGYKVLEEYLATPRAPPEVADAEDARILRVVHEELPEMLKNRRIYYHMLSGYGGFIDPSLFMPGAEFWHMNSGEENRNPTAAVLDGTMVAEYWMDLKPNIAAAALGIKNATIAVRTAAAIDALPTPTISAADRERLKTRANEIFYSISVKEYDRERIMDETIEFLAKLESPGAQPIIANLPSPTAPTTPAPAITQESFNNSVRECSEDPLLKRREEWFVSTLKQEDTQHLFSDAEILELAALLAREANGKIRLIDTDTIEDRGFANMLRNFAGRSRFLLDQDMGSGETMFLDALSNSWLFSRNNARFVSSDDKQALICRIYKQWLQKNIFNKGGQMAESSRLFNSDITSRYNIRLVSDIDSDPNRIDVVRMLLLLLPESMLSSSYVRDNLAGGINTAASRFSSTRTAHYDDKSKVLGIQNTRFTTRELIEAFLHEFGHVIETDYAVAFEQLLSDLGNPDIYRIAALGYSGKERYGYIRENITELFAETFMHYILHGELMESGFAAEGVIVPKNKTIEEDRAAWKKIYEFYRDKVFGGVEYRVVNGVLQPIRRPAAAPIVSVLLAKPAPAPTPVASVATTVFPNVNYEELAERNWYYRQYDASQREGFRRNLKGLSSEFPSRIREVVLTELGKVGITLPQTSQISIVLYGSWAYGFGSSHIPSDINVIVVVDEIDRDIGPIHYAIDSRAGWFNDERSTKICNIEIRGKTNLKAATSLESELSERAKLWGHGVLIFGPALDLERPTREALFGAARSIANAGVIESEGTEPDVQKMARRWIEVMRIMDYIESEATAGRIDPLSVQETQLISFLRRHNEGMSASFNLNEMRPGDPWVSELMTELQNGLLIASGQLEIPLAIPEPVTAEIATRILEDLWLEKEHAAYCRVAALFVRTDKDVRGNVLGILTTKDAIPIPVRKAAINGIAHLAGTEKDKGNKILDAIIGRINDENAPSVREAAINGIAHLAGTDKDEGNKILDAIIGRINDEKVPPVLEAVINSIAHLAGTEKDKGNKILDAIIGRINDKNAPPVRKAAINGVAHLVGTDKDKDDIILDAIIGRINDEKVPSVLEAAINGIARLAGTEKDKGNKILDAIIGRINDKNDPSVREAAINTLMLACLKIDARAYWNSASHNPSPVENFHRILALLHRYTHRAFNIFVRNSAFALTGFPRRKESAAISESRVADVTVDASGLTPQGRSIVIPDGSGEGGLVYKTFKPTESLEDMAEEADLMNRIPGDSRQASIVKLTVKNAPTGIPSECMALCYRMNNLKQHFSYPLDWKVDAATLKRWMENASEELYALILQGAGYTGILEFFHDVATNRKYNLSADPVGCIDNFRRAFQYANMRAGGHIVDLNRQHMARFSEDGPTRAELAGCLRDQLFQLTLIAAVVTSDNNHTASDLEETLRAIARRTCSLYGASYDELEEAMPLDLASVSREALYAIRNPQRGVDLGWDNGPLSCPGLVAFAETMAMRIAQVQQPASTTAQVDTIESRRAAVTDAGAAVSMRDAKVRVLCGVTQDMDMSRVRNILSEANRVLKKKGYGQLDGEQDFRTFNMPVGESGSMNQAAIESGIIDSIDTKMGEDETLVIFVPRIKGVCDIDTSPGSDFVQRCLAKHANTIIVPDAYADSIANPETRRMVINGHQVKTYPDIIARMMIGRILAWMKAAPSEEATNALLDYLGKISPQAQKVELAGVKNLEDILKKLNETALRIMPIDYTDLENFRDSQIATAVSA